MALGLWYWVSMAVGRQSKAIDGFLTPRQDGNDDETRLVSLLVDRVKSKIQMIITGHVHIKRLSKNSVSTCCRTLDLLE